MYDQLDVPNYTLVELLSGANPNLPNPLPVLQTEMPGLNCPSDANRTYPLVGSERHFGGGVGTTAGGYGNWRPSSTNYMSSRGMRNNNQTDVASDTHGMFMGVLSVRIRDVTDGTSNTFLLGERDTQNCRGGTWIGVRNPLGNGTRGFYYNTANCRVILNAPDPPLAWNSREGCSEGFASLHKEGANFALADGSVRFIHNDVEVRPCKLDTNGDGTVENCFDWFNPGNDLYEPVYGVYERLARRNDGFRLAVPE
jgi:prepilin-type processing-associated H-X9-DG protein